MKITLKDAETKKALREKIPSHYNEPDPERRLSIWDSNPSLESIMSFSESQREKITCVSLCFTKDFPAYIAELKHFPNLRELYFSDCYWVEPVGIDVYCGLSELKKLDTLQFRDSITIDDKTIKEIAQIPCLRSLIIQLQSIASAKDLAGLEGCKTLEYLELWIDQCEVFAEDLAFVASLGNLKWLELDGCDRIDVARLHLPRSLVAFTPPSYGYRTAKKIVPEGCVVVKPGTIHPPCRNRYVPQAQKDAMAQARKAESNKERAVQRAKRRVATAVKSLQNELPFIGYKNEKLESLLAEIEQFLSENNS